MAAAAVPAPSSVPSRAEFEEKLNKTHRGKPLARQIESIDEEYELVIEPTDAEPGCLGKGTYGVVKRYRSRRTGDIVAIKELDKTRLLSSQKSLKHIIVEITVLRNLRHPNCIQLIDVLHNSSKLFIVMEYCKGGELYHFIASNRTLQPDVAAVILKQILMALSYIHREHIVHRDIKPENILIDRETLHIKLIDFGLAKYCGPASQEFPSPCGVNPDMIGMNARANYAPSPLIENTPCGTELYSALESISGILDNQVGRKPWLSTRGKLPKLDVYGAGVITYAMLTGKLPYRSSYRQQPYRRPTQQDRERRLQDIRNKMHQGPQFPMTAQNLPREALECVQRLMLNECMERPTAHEALQHPWLKDVKVPVKELNIPAPMPHAPVVGMADKSGFTITGVPKPKKSRKSGSEGSSPVSPSQEGSPSRPPVAVPPPVARPEPPVPEVAKREEPAVEFVDEEETPGEEEGEAAHKNFKSDWAEMMRKMREGEDDDVEVKEEEDDEMQDANSE